MTTQASPSRWGRAWTWAAMAILLAPAGLAGAEDKAAASADHVQQRKQGLALFQESVRPVLVKHCLDCHGGKATKGEFDLSDRKTLLESGAVDGGGKESRLYALIAHEEEPHMPHKAAKLPDKAIEQIARWIDLGAPYDRPLHERRPDPPTGALALTDAQRNFWAFLPLGHAVPPPVRDGAWCRTPIDRFVLAKLEAKGLTPNPAADRRVLIRRLSFDLIGLPPAPEEVDEFLADPAPEAYARRVDRLLDSPHYGERWARHWMDVARFAESHGYEQDYDRPYAYHYRDFLIKALNADMPYDQFARWQVAGDELAPDDPQALAATGFLGAGAFPTQLTEAEFESARYEELSDMTSTTGSAFLGLSVGCARCHDHKYDPIPASDYYRMAASFTTAIRSEIDVNLQPEEYRGAQAHFDREHAQLTQSLARFEERELPGRLERWIKSGAKPTLPKWLVLDQARVTSAGGATLTKQDDGSFLAGGTNPPTETFTFTAETPLRGITAVRLDALAHASLVKRGPGRASNGNFALTDFRVTAATRDGKGTPVPVKLVNPRATFQQEGFPVAAALDDDAHSGWAVDPRFGKDHSAVFEFEAPLTLEGGAALTFTLKFENNVNHSLGRPRLAITTAPQPLGLDGDLGSHSLVVVEEILRTPEERRTPAQVATLRTWYRTIDPEWQALDRAIREHRAQAPQPKLTKMQVTAEGFPHTKHHADDRGFPHFYPKTFLLNRGDVHQKKGEAEPGFLRVLMRDGKELAHWRVEPPEGWTRSSFRRAALARWMTDPEHGAGHLAARVMVNRVWQHHFGRGLVATPNDFGAQGERPSHPELLDWLAADLIAHGWRLKHLHRQILASAAYMQDGRYDENRAALDRENVLLWRQTPRRLEAEPIRDAMLKVAGLLDEQPFGPGSLDPSMRRRSVYFFIKRSQLIPSMMLFDWPEHLVSIGQRGTTTTASQALLFLNSPQGRQCAEGFAARLAGASDADAVRKGYRLAYGREPTEAESQLAAEFLESQGAAYAKAGRPDPRSLAMVDLCQALLGASDFIYIP